MAFLYQKKDTYYCTFRYQRRRYTFTVGEVDRQEAEEIAAAVDLVLRRIKQQLHRVPAGVGIAQFVQSTIGGKEVKEAAGSPAAEPITLKHFRERYIETHKNGTMEERSLDTAAMHLNHFTRTLGLRFTLQGLTLAHLQDHVNQRARKRTKAGRALSPNTLRKEVSSLRAAWNWGVQMGLLSGPFPGRGLRYPKGDEKPPFQTWAEIERLVIRGRLTTAQKRELWDCLFLTLQEVTELLGFIKASAAHPWVYPMACFAAHTGARRSEMLRVKLEHLDLDGGSVLIHEKKRDKTKRTTRRVPLSPLLVSVIKEYLTEHAGGEFLFCHGEEVFRSKTRSKTTGHKGEKTRASTLKGRLAGVSERGRPGLGPLTRDEAHDHLKRTLKGSKWEVVRGWHIFRHSFCSILAMKGCDQRVIDEFVGHQTEEQQRRYRHLAPDVKRQAIVSAFGGG